MQPKKESLDHPDSWSPDPRHADPLPERLAALRMYAALPNIEADSRRVIRGLLAEVAALHATLRETAQERDYPRLVEQAQAISRILAEAGVGPGTLTEGVRALIQRGEQAEAALKETQEALAIALPPGMSMEGFIQRVVREAALGSSPVKESQ